jgi:selenocysteine-specific elongation factor
MPPQELRNRLGLSSRAFEGAFGLWTESGDASEVSGSIALPNHSPTPNTTQTTRAEAFLAALDVNPYAPVTESPIDDDLLAYLEDQGRIVRCGDGVAFSAAAYREMESRIVAHLREHKTITLAQVRDMFATSRKYAQALLEHLDGRHVTRRSGDERVLR